jgi:hypothetical protein
LKPGHGIPASTELGSRDRSCAGPGQRGGMTWIWQIDIPIRTKKRKEGVLVRPRQGSGTLLGVLSEACRRVPTFDSGDGWMKSALPIRLPPQALHWRLTSHTAAFSCELLQPTGSGRCAARRVGPAVPARDLSCRGKGGGKGYWERKRVESGAKTDGSKPGSSAGGRTGEKAQPFGAIELPIPVALGPSLTHH